MNVILSSDSGTINSLNFKVNIVLFNYIYQRELKLANFIKIIKLISLFTIHLTLDLNKTSIELLYALHLPH